MRDYAKEFENRVAFIRDLLKSSGAKGVIYGNSGGKDSALVGILCKAAQLRRGHDRRSGRGRAVQY